MSEENISSADIGTVVLGRAKIAYEFTALETFESKEFGSGYEKGLTYSIREGNDRLLTAARAWAKDGKVLLYPFGQAPRRSSRVAGIGEVSDSAPKASKKKK